MRCADAGTEAGRSGIIHGTTFCAYVRCADAGIEGVRSVKKMYKWNDLMCVVLMLALKLAAQVLFIKCPYVFMCGVIMLGLKVFAQVK